MIYIIGMIISVLFDLFWFVMAKRGFKLPNYPQVYLKYTKIQLILVWVFWSLLWPIILGMTVFDFIKGWKKS